MYKTLFLSLGLAAVILPGCNESPTDTQGEPCDDFLLQYGAVGTDTVTTSSGVRYVDVELGSGILTADVSDVATVNYSGYLQRTSQLFDSSCFQGAGAVAFQVGDPQIIDGFSIGVIGMKAGGLRRVIIPSSLAYGSVDQSNHPLAGEDLVFDMQLVELR